MPSNTFMRKSSSVSDLWPRKAACGNAADSQLLFLAAVSKQNRVWCYSCTLCSCVYLMEADHRLWVNANYMQTPAVALEKPSKQPQEDGSDFLVLKHKRNLSRVTENHFLSFQRLFSKWSRPSPTKQKSWFLTWIFRAEGCDDCGGKAWSATSSSGSKTWKSKNKAVINCVPSRLCPSEVLILTASTKLTRPKHAC